MDVECSHCHHRFELKLKCKRCDHEWTPRENGPPKVCPKCKSPYWNKDRVKNLKKKNK